MESPLASNGPPRYNGGAPYHTPGAHEDDFGPETDVDGESAAHVLKALKEERNASQKVTSSSEHALNLSSAGSSDSEGEEGVEGGGWDFVQGRGKETTPSSLQTSHKVTNFDSDSDSDEHHHTKVNDQDDLDDMNHPLNPDAAEFVPVTSPVKTPTSKLPWETDNGLKRELENGFDKKSFDIHGIDMHAGNGVDLIGTDSNGHGIDIHAFDKTRGLDIHNNGDAIDVRHSVEASHDILGAVDIKNHRAFEEVENDEIIACSPKKPDNVNNVEDEDNFLDDIKKRPSSGFEAKENGDHDNDHDDMNGFETLDVSKAQATLGDSTINYMADLSTTAQSTLGDSTINYMADLSTTMASPHQGNLLSEDYTTSSLSPSSPHGAADSQASNPFDPTWTDKNETHDFDRHTDFEQKHNDDFGNNEHVEKTIDNNVSNRFSSDFTGANSEDLAVETSAKVHSSETLLHGEENVHLEEDQTKHREEIVSHSETGASKKDAFEDQFVKEDELDVKPSAPFDPADNVKANNSSLSNFEFDDESHHNQQEVDNFSHSLEQHGAADVADFTTESAAPVKFDATTFNEFHTANDNSEFFAKDQTHSDDAPFSLASQTPLNYAEETLQSMLDLVQTPNSTERRISSDVMEAYNDVAHSMDTPAASKHAELDFNFELSDKKESQFGQQEEAAETQCKQEIVDESYAHQKEEFGVNDDKKDVKIENIEQDQDDIVNGSYVEESHVEIQESRELESVVEQTQENDQLESEQQAGSDLTGDNDLVKAEAEKDLHQTLQTEEFEFHREDNATSASTLDETTPDDFKSFIAKQEREGNVETFTMGGMTAGDFLAKHGTFVEQNATEEDNVNEIVKDTNVESTEALTHVEANVTEAVNNVSESIQEEEEDEEIQIGKKVSNLNESDVMSQSFYGNYDEEPARSPSPEEMIDHYERAQQQQGELAADESSRFDSSVEAASELTPTTETTTLEAKLAQGDEHLAETRSEETKQPEEEQKTVGELFEISHEETSYNKSAQEQFDDLTFGSKTSESSFQQEVEEVVEQSSVPALETNLDDFTPQETKIESEFLEDKEEVSGPVSVPDVIPTLGNEDSQTPAVDLTQDIVEDNTLPAGDVSAENIEAASPVVEKQEASVSQLVANETVEEKSETSSTVAKAAAAVGVAAVVGAAAAVAAKKATTAVKKPTAASATKKTDVKAPISKTSTGAKPLAKTTTAAKPAAKLAPTTTTAKKPVTTAAKSTLATKSAPKPAPAKPAAPKPSTTTAAKPAPIRKPVASTLNKTTTTSVSAAPKPATARPAPKPAVSAAPKPKPVTTTATKPLTNGVAKRPVTATSTAAPRTTATKPTAPTKPAAPRVPLSQRTSTITSSKPSTLSSSTVKKTSTSTTAPARKPLSSVTSKVGSNLKPKVGAAGTATKPSSNAIKKTETKTSSTTPPKPVVKIEASPVVTETVASPPVMTNGH
uniref:Ataxin-2 C-terminal domain-containing protein n=1 Tax=Cacopsylla melanoneura TaxID=428564 RepID=A0A8D8XXV6_9HEMI